MSVRVSALTGGLAVSLAVLAPSQSPEQQAAKEWFLQVWPDRLPTSSGNAGVTSR
jgi:hypothetical protein